MTHRTIVSAGLATVVAVAVLTGCTDGTDPSASPSATSPSASGTVSASASARATASSAPDADGEPSSEPTVEDTAGWAEDLPFTIEEYRVARSDKDETATAELAYTLEMASETDIRISLTDWGWSSTADGGDATAIPNTTIYVILDVYPGAVSALYSGDELVGYLYPATSAVTGEDIMADFEDATTTWRTTFDVDDLREHYVGVMTWSGKAVHDSTVQTTHSHVLSYSVVQGATAG
ncbi:hypothetical protein [Demequina sp. NBRC 110054]|uniref:hypothetical protein n=1 Tax=Demequina sp. NBRC 110054 TaxID=1570343 RepID=UPI000A00BE13|nr:hypothetical protein [Demequina sp. NBRC 110054]